MPAIIEKRIHGEQSTLDVIFPGKLALLKMFNPLDGSEEKLVILCNEDDNDTMVFDSSLIEEADVAKGIRSISEVLEDCDPLDVIVLQHEGEHNLTLESPDHQIMELNVVHQALLSRS